jgi:hypothetical protein
MMAFTFGIMAARFDTRKELLLDEVNAICTAYLRAGLLREPQRTETRRLMRQYVDLRVGLAMGKGGPETLREAIARSEAMQNSLWSHAEALAVADRSSQIDALFISALNETFDLHTKRVVVALQYRIPIVVWGVLLFVSVLSMAAVGFQFGLSGKRSLLANLALTLTFSAVTFLIFDLDRPTQGWFRVSQQPMIELQQKLNAPAR